MSDVRLAKVGDVIEHGQAIPANVQAMSDNDGDLWRRTGRDEWTWPEDGEPTGTDHLNDRPHWWPMAVVEVDPEPQPADPLRCPTCDSPQPSMHPAAGGGGEVISICSDGFHAPAAFDADGFLRLKGTATGDNQLDPEPVEISQHCNGCGNWMPPPALHKATCPTRTPGPLVLTLPEVPPGAVLAGASGHDYVLRGGVWDDVVGPWSGKLGAVLDREHPKGVTVELAPPREPRTWPKLDAAPVDLKAFTGRSGTRYVRSAKVSTYAAFVPESKVGDARELISCATASHWQEIDGPLTEVLT